MNDRPADFDQRAVSVDWPKRQARAAFEADYIIKELKQHQGNVSRVARALGLSRSSLQKKMKDYGLR